MTCRLSQSNWLDVLYNTVRRTDGGIEDAARFLTHRRDRSITPQSLRNKLRGLPGESLSLEMADLLTEWMYSKSASYSRDWLQAFCAVHGGTFHVTEDVPLEPKADLLRVVERKLISLASLHGKLSDAAVDAAVDDMLDQAERDSLLVALRALKTKAARLENVLMQQQPADAGK